MPFPSETFLQHIRNSAVAAGQWVSDEFSNLYAQIEGWLRVEHKDDGSHGDITGDSLTLTKDADAGTTGNLDVGGTLDVFSDATFIDDVVAIGTRSSLDARGLTDIGAGVAVLATSPVMLMDSGGRRWVSLTGADSYDEFFAIGIDGVGALGLERALNIYYVSGSSLFEISPPLNSLTNHSFNLGSTSIRWDEAHVDQYFRATRTVAEGEWQDFSPTWTGTSSNPAIGNGTLRGRYTLIGETCIGFIHITAGSTTTFGLGSWEFAPPVTDASDDGYVHVAVAGTSNYRDSDSGSGQLFYPAHTRLLSGDVMRVELPAGGYLAHNTITWATSDEVWVNFTYEIA